MMQASFQVLNKTNPNLTEHCWLCYGVNPPYYEGIAVNDTPSQANSINPAQCLWQEEKQSITITEVRGSGTCVGKVPKHDQGLCAYQVQYKTSTEWLIAATNTKWVCSSTGITPCLSVNILSESSEYCVQVIVIPKIFYHPENYADDLQATPEHHLVKREPITALTVGLIMLIRGAGVGTGAASLIRQNKEFGQLKEAVDEDIAGIQKSIDQLAQSLKSLSEVVLQNRRALDIVFLREGGMCAALKEECCVYVDHTGIVRDSMAKLRERLEKRKKDREQDQQNWFTSLFNQSPWLTTLISTLMGPIIMILLTLIFGPCILNKLISFVKSRLEAVNIMLIERQQLL